MAGYRAKFKPDDEVIILSVDAATTGRLAATYYQEVPGNEFIDRVLHWHQNCTWSRWIKLHETKKWVFINNTAPSPNEIALAAYGTEQEKGYLACSDKLKKNYNPKNFTVYYRIKPENTGRYCESCCKQGFKSTGIQPFCVAELCDAGWLVQ